MKKTSKYLIIFIIFTQLLCKGTPPAPAEQVAFEEVCNEKYDMGRDEKNREVRHRVSFEGFLAFPSSLMMSTTVLINAYKEPDKKGEFVRVSFKIGSRDNRIEKPPKSYKDSDLKVKANDGTEVGYNKKVKLHGFRGGSKKDNSCYLSVELVEVVQ